MTDYSLRPATADDFEFTRMLHRLTLKPYVKQIWGWDEDQQLKLLKERFEPAKLQVICQNRKDVGVLQIEQRPTEVFIGNVLLLPEFQGKGLGGKIIRDIENAANKKNLPVTLTVLKPNPAKRLYERLGFAVTSEDQVRYYLKNGS